MQRGILKSRIPLDLQSRFFSTKDKVEKTNTLRLLTWIKDELDPQNFTPQEILDEGWVGLETRHSTGFNSEVEVPKLLSTLCSQGLIEKKEEGESYEITEKGLETQELKKGDISEMVGVNC